MGKPKRQQSKKVREQRVVQDKPGRLPPSPAPAPVRVEVEAGYPEGWCEQLRESAEVVKAEQQRHRLLIAQAVAAGATWAEVGTCLGVTKQTAWERYRHLVPVVKPAEPTEVES